MTDLAVVGGGIIGAFVAHEARRRYPDWRVALLERGTIGAATTVWSAGVSFPLAATPGHVPLVRESARAYAALAGSPFLRPVQMIYVVRPATRAAFTDRLVDATPRPVTAAEERRVRALLPDLHLGTEEEMLTHDGHGFAVRPRPLAETLTLAGVEVHLGQRVTAIDDGFRLTTDHSGFTADRVVVATGPWTGPDRLPAAPGQRRKRIAALHARLPVTLDDPLVYFVDDDLFLLPLAPGSALVSFYREEWDTDPDTVDGRPVPADLAAGTAALARRSRVAADAVSGGRAYCDLYTEHRLPVVVTDPARPGLAAVRGGSGSGVRLAPGLAAAALTAVSAAYPRPVPTRHIPVPTH